MRLISRFRDYYDYMAHQHTDPKIVYVRQCVEYRDEPPYGEPYTEIGPHKADAGELFTGPTFARIHFCGTRYSFAFIGGDFLYDLRAMYDAQQQMQAEGYSPAPGNRRYHRWHGPARYSYFEDSMKPVSSTHNAVLNAPVVLEIGTMYLTNCQLSAIDFVRVFAPEQAFMTLYNFLTPSEIEPDGNPDNMIRYEAKGFDKTTSFRKPKP